MAQNLESFAVSPDGSQPDASARLSQEAHSIIHERGNEKPHAGTASDTEKLGSDNKAIEHQQDKSQYGDGAGKDLREHNLIWKKSISDSIPR